MMTKFEIDGLTCNCVSASAPDKIAYILYPMEIPENLIEKTAKEFGVSVAVISGMDWQNVFSPWPAAGVPSGTPDFKGESPEFLKLLINSVIPEIDKHIRIDTNAERTLIGVSMSGLFALWQWMKCDCFLNIASLSGSFWYDGFVEWMKSIDIPDKKGKAYFLLGDKESQSKVKEFRTVASDTEEVLRLLDAAGIETEFQNVPGDHYSDPTGHLIRAFKALFK